MGRYRHRPLHLFGGVGLASLVGVAILAYLTVLKIGGPGSAADRCSCSACSLVVVGVQFLSLGLIGEMLTSHHEEKLQSTRSDRAHVRDVLR